MYMAINLWEVWSDRSWNDAAISTEGIKWSSVNNLCHLMNESRFIKKSRRKSQHLCVGYVFKWMKTLVNSFFCRLQRIFCWSTTEKKLEKCFLGARVQSSIPLFHKPIFLFLNWDLLHAIRGTEFKKIKAYRKSI